MWLLRFLGQYSFYTISINSLQDVPSFPVIIDGHLAGNDKTRLEQPSLLALGRHLTSPRYFLGRTVLQRPSLTSVNGVMIGAFGGLCDQYSYTGMLIAISKTPCVGVTSIYTMEASPGAPLATNH